VIIKLFGKTVGITENKGTNVMNKPKQNSFHTLGSKSCVEVCKWGNLPIFFRVLDRSSYDAILMTLGIW